MTTRTPKTQRTTKTGKTDSTKPTSETLRESEIENKLKEDVAKFRAVSKKKAPPPVVNQLSPRIYLAGMAMSALISRSNGPVRMGDVKEEAYQWADFMLSKE